MSRSPVSTQPPSPRRSRPRHWPEPKVLRGRVYLHSSLLQHERAYTIYYAPPPWPHHARGLPELDDGRTLYLGTLAHLFAVVHRHLHPLPIEVGLPLSCLGFVHGLWFRQFGLLDRDRGDEAHVHELDGLVLHTVAVALLVRGVEAVLQLL